MVHLGSTACRIEEVIHASGGVTRSELCDRTGLGWGTVGHHIWRLEAARRIRTQKVGRFLWLFPTTVGVDEGCMIAGLRRPEARRVLESVVTRRETTVGAVSDATHLPRRVVSNLLLTLEAVGLVDKRCSNPNRYMAAGPHAQQLLQALEPSVC